MPPKRTSTSAAPAMTQAAIRKLVADSVVAALETQAATMANTKNTNRNTRPRETPVARKGNYKEFVSCQPFYFNGTKGVVGLIHWTLHCQVSYLQQGGSYDQELQKQRASHQKQSTTSVVTCHARGEKWHYNYQCSKANNNAHEITYLLKDKNAHRDLNVVTGMFLLNQHLARVLFDSGEYKSFVSTSLASMLNIPPITLDTFYDIEMANGNLVSTNTVIQGCTMTLLNQPFKIDLMPIKLSSFDVVIGMDWLSKYHARIICDEKVVHIPIVGKTLIIQGDQIMEKKSDEKRLEDILVVRESSEVFLEDLPGLPPVRQVEFQIDLIPRAAPEFKIHSDREPQVVSELEKINVLNLEVKLRDKVLAEYTTNLEKVEKERDELKLTLEKLQNSSKSLNTLLDSQVSDKSKAGLGYKELILESFVNSFKLLEKQDNRSDKGYHEVPPPLTGNCMPPKRDLRLIDEHFETESVDVSTVSSSDVKIFKTVDHNDDDIEDELSPTIEVKTVKPSVEKIESVKTAREKVKTEESSKQHKHHPRGNQRNLNNLMSHRLGRVQDPFRLGTISGIRARKLGGGESTFFWLHRWVEDFTLKEKFPRLLRLESRKEVTVVEIGVWREGRWNGCGISKEEVETIDHCFLKCGRVLEGWIKVLDWWKMSNVTHGSVDEERWSTKSTSWLSRNLEQSPTSKLHAMGNVSSIPTSQPIASNERDF
nr:hypothetical protein [Tanacetum cinerariifolium]